MTAAFGRFSGNNVVIEGLEASNGQLSYEQILMEIVHDFRMASV